MRPISVFAALLLMCSTPVLARSLDGVNIPDQLTVAGEKPADANLKRAVLGGKE